MHFLEEYLIKEVKPALGCTEPGAIAYCVSLAVSHLRDSIERVEVITSKNVYKNGMYVYIPGTGEKGNEVAAALGAICGDSSLQLEALKPCCAESVALAREMIDSGRVTVRCDTSRTGIYIEAIAKGSVHTSRVVIKDHHTRVVLVERDGREIESDEGAVESRDIDFTVEDIFKAVDEMTESEIDRIFEGINMNLEIARYGLEKIVAPREKAEICESGSLGYRIRKYCLAASAARMTGAPLPVMSSGGSGNQGIVATLPVVLVGVHHGKSRGEIARAVAISHLFSSYLKRKLGRIAPICGCVTTAGTGATAGIAYLLGGDRSVMERAMITMLSNTTGMMCDGAKESCALKAGLGGQEAYSCALLAIDELGIDSAQGFIAPTLDKSIENIQLLMSRGMSEIDNAIIELLEKRR
jgi:L-cysteine desulfidase